MAERQQKKTKLFQVITAIIAFIMILAMVLSMIRF